jgi:hypothetical protein
MAPAGMFDWTDNLISRSPSSKITILACNRTF